MEKATFRQQLDWVLPLDVLSPPDHTREPAIREFSDYVFMHSHLEKALYDVSFREVRTFIPEVFWVRLGYAWRIRNALQRISPDIMNQRSDPKFELPNTNMGAVLDLVMLEEDRLFNWIIGRLERITFLVYEALDSLGGCELDFKNVPEDVRGFLEENKLCGPTVKVYQILPLLSFGTEVGIMLRQLLVETFLPPP